MYETFHYDVKVRKFSAPNEWWSRENARLRMRLGESHKERLMITYKT